MPGGRTEVITTTLKDFDVPDEALSCLIEPIKFGRSDAPVLCPGRMWSPDTGMVDLQTWKDRVEMEKQKKQMQADMEKAAARKAKEARERAAKAPEVISEKPAKEFVARKGKDVAEVVSEKPAKKISEK